LGIIYFYQKLEPLRLIILNLIKSERLKAIFNKWIVLPFFVSLAAQISTLPLTMHYFHKLSLISFFLNILVIPFIGFIVTLGFIFLSLSFLNTALAALLAAFMDALVQLLLNLVEGAANIPGAYFYIPRFSILSMLIYLSIVILIFNLTHKKLRRIFGIISLTLVIISLSISLFKPKPFNVIVLDVGQGDASLIATPMGKTILIDSGPGNKYLNVAQQAIYPVMNHLGTKHLDALFISHPHLDHMGGTFELLKYVSIDSAYLPPLSMRYKWNDSLKTVFTKNSIPWRNLNIGDKITIDYETRIYTLGPFPRFSKFRKASGHNLNNNSLILLVKHKDHSLLFPGDAEKEVERDLVIWGDILDSDLLKVGHHGSKTSSTENFLAEVSPDFSFISVGENNKFKHPSPLVLERLAKFNSRVFRTDKNSAVWFQLNNGKWRELDWR
jgi:competence protein ComEC